MWAGFEATNQEMSCMTYAVPQSVALLEVLKVNDAVTCNKV